MRVCYWLFLCIGTALLTGCATPAEKVDLLVQEYRFEKQVVSGAQFKHVVYTQGRPRQSKRIYVYIEGDGSPKVNRKIISPDPTPRNPLMLKLMAETKLPGVYVGRPCYFGLHNSNGCDTSFWTSHRYSVEVVQSMAEAIKQFTLADTEIVLLGHSGGGTIATLLAERIDNVVALITISANLDTHQWTLLHNYEALHGSLNPSSRAALNQDIYQVHVAGGQDTNVPPEIVSAYVDMRPGTNFRLYEDQDHSCCWHEIWRQLLDEIEIYIQ